SSSVGSPALSSISCSVPWAMILPSSMAMSPIEALRFVHVRGRDQHAHLGPAGANSVDQVPELAARQWVNASGGLVENEQVRIVDQRAAKAELLLHAAGKLAGGAGLERIKRGGGQEFGDLCAPLGGRLPEQPAKEIDVLEYTKCRIEIAAQALRHIGDARAQAFKGRPLGYVAVEDADLPALHRAHAGNEREHGRFADAVRPDHANHFARRNFDRDIVEGDRRPVTVRNTVKSGDDGIGHCGSLTCKSSGHAVALFVHMTPSPRTPVFTRRLYCFRTSASTCSLTRNISFSRSSPVSTVFGVNCASAATKLTEAGTTYCGTGSRMIRASLPISNLPATAAGAKRVM